MVTNYAVYFIVFRTEKFSIIRMSHAGLSRHILSLDKPFLLDSIQFMSNWE